MNRRGVGALLIGDSVDSRFAGDVRGVRWITDGYVAARVDVFKQSPKVSELDYGPAIRRHLVRVRKSPVLGEARDSTHRTWNSPNGYEIALIHTGRPLYLAVNAAAWEGWERTGLTPKITESGHLTWWGPVRGKPVLFGVVMPVHLWSVYP